MTTNRHEDRRGMKNKVAGLPKADIQASDSRKTAVGTGDLGGDRLLRVGWSGALWEGGPSGFVRMQSPGFQTAVQAGWYLPNGALPVVGVVVAMVMVFLLLHSGCSNDAQTLTKEDVCAGVDCSGQGRCVTAGDADAVCLCDPGYHAEGLSCVEDVSGEECSGVSCSGHGSCLVVQGEPAYPVCLCDEGYRIQGNTNCVAEETGGGVTCGPGTVELNGQCVAKDECPDGDCTPGICNSSQDCPDGKVCIYETGACVDATEEQCINPSSGSGNRKLGKECVSTASDPDLTCAQGLVCVPYHYYMDKETGQLIRRMLPADPTTDWDGVCAQACNPCQDSCGEVSGCIGLSQGGGVCVPQGRLASEGDVCAQGLWRIAWCEAGLDCSSLWLPATAQEPGRCVRPCVPDNPEIWNSTIFASTESADCPSGQVCTHVLDSADFAFFYCEVGQLQPTGQACNNETVPEAKCAWPDRCRNLGVTGRPGTCSPISDCSEGCPAGTNCRFQGSTVPEPACVAPGAVGGGGFCEEDIDCMAPLTCKMRPTTFGQRKICVP